MNQLSLLPIDTMPAAEARRSREPVALGDARERRGGTRALRPSPRLAPRTAVGAPGYLSVRAAAERLGLRPRSVRSLIERGRLRSQRLGRMHFLPTAQVEAYRRGRRRSRS